MAGTTIQRFGTVHLRPRETDRDRLRLRSGIRFDLVEPALEQFLSSLTGDVHIEPDAVTPQPRFVEADRPGKRTSDYLRLSLRRADAQSEDHRQSGTRAGVKLRSMTENYAV